MKKQCPNGCGELSTTTGSAPTVLEEGEEGLCISTGIPYCPVCVYHESDIETQEEEQGDMRAIMFQSMYWYWQTGAMLVQEIARELKITHRAAYEMCCEYEQTDNYTFHAEVQMGLRNTPKRGKLPDPELFKSVYNTLESGRIDEKEAARRLDLKWPPDVRRVYLAYSKGRNAII